MEKKRCPKCEIDKSLDCFHKCKIKPGGLQTYCKDCHKATYNDLKLRGKIKIDYKQLRLAKFKFRAKEQNIPFNLTIEDMDAPEYCPILGCKLIDGLNGKENSYSPSLDRIVPELGYVKGNVMWMSRKANTMKNNATEEELVAFCKFFTNKLNNNE